MLKKGILRIVAVFIITIKRLLSRRGLALATLLGMIASVAITASIPLYADAVFNRVLRKELVERKNNYRASREPYSYLFAYLGSLAKSVTWVEIQPLDQYLTQNAPLALGLPKKFIVQFFKSDTFKLFPSNDTSYADKRDPLEWVYFSTMSDLEKHITVSEGTYPQVSLTNNGQPLEVLMSEQLATKLGAQAGEDYIVYVRRNIDKEETTIKFPVRVSGIWKPNDANENYWFQNPEGLSEALLIPMESYTGFIDSSMKDPVYAGLWYLAMDGTYVNSSEALPLLRRSQDIQQRVMTFMPETSVLVSPIDALQKYRTLSSQMTFMLFVFGVPIMGLLLVFISMVVSLSVGQQQNEIAVLRSRGATLFQIIGMACVEAVALGFIAICVGLPLGSLIAYMMGKTRTFLDFSGSSNIHVTMTTAAVEFSLFIIFATLITQLIPTYKAAQHSIISYKQEQARTLRPPWWQRAWVDVILLIPAVYGTYQLRKQGSITLPGGAGTLTNDPFQNPLLLLIPALGILAMALLIIRFLPYLMRLIARIAARTSSVGFLLAARHLARTAGSYTAPMILLVVTLSLSAYTASLAKTMDRSYIDQTYYKNGSDTHMTNLGEQSGAPSAGISFTPPSKDQVEEEKGATAWFFLPVSEYLKLPGIQSATRVGTYEVSIPTGAGTITGSKLIGVDRADFTKTAYWRSDFASNSLGRLMNKLATTPDGVLVTRSFLQRSALQIGDPLKVEMDNYLGQINKDVNLKIVGVFDLFPTWYPEKETDVALVANLDYIYEQAGSELPHDVWLKASPNVNMDTFKQSAIDIGLNTLGIEDSRLQIQSEQQRPERQGLFGMLSVGFTAGALLTVLGFLLYALFSFRSRFIELGVLRAVGLSSQQMISFLAWELAFLLLVGLIAGTILGVGMSHLLIPYLQIGTDLASRIPSYIVIIAWPEIIRIYVLFALLFMTSLSVLIYLLLRMKIFEAIKLGETV